MIHNKDFVDMVLMCGRAVDAGLVRASSGNASIRSAINASTAVITKTGVWLSRGIEYNDMVVVPSFRDIKLNELDRPTSEIHMHVGILSQTQYNCVLHFQSPCLTALSFLDDFPPIDVIPEIPYYVKRYSTVEYITPGSIALATKVTEEVRCGSRLVILKNHGQVAVGKDINETLQVAIFSELAAECVLKVINKEYNIVESFDTQSLIEGTT